MMAPTLNGFWERSTATRRGRRNGCRLSRISSSGSSNGGTFTAGDYSVDAGPSALSVGAPPPPPPPPAQTPGEGEQSRWRRRCSPAVVLLVADDDPGRS